MSAEIRFQPFIGRGASLAGMFDQLLENGIFDPKTRADMALHQSKPADRTVEKPPITATRWTDQWRVDDIQRFSRQWLAAMIAKPGMIANPREATWANRIEVLLMEREIGVAEFAPPAAVMPRRAARFTANHRRIMPFRLIDRQHFATPTTKPAADSARGRIVLTLTFRARNQKTHRDT
jgi:hypothetical protein